MTYGKAFQKMDDT